MPNREKTVAFPDDVMRVLELFQTLEKDDSSEVFGFTRFAARTKPIAAPVRAVCEQIVRQLQDIGSDGLNELVPLHEDSAAGTVHEACVTVEHPVLATSVPLLPMPYETQALSFMAFVHNKAQIEYTLIYEACPIDLTRPAAIVSVGDSQATLSYMALRILEAEPHTLWYDLSRYKDDLAADPRWDAAADLGGALQLLRASGTEVTSAHLACVRQALVHAARVEPAFLEQFSPPVPQDHNRLLAGLLALEQASPGLGSGRLWSVSCALVEQLTPAHGQASLLHYHLQHPGGNHTQGCIDLVAAGHPVSCRDENGRTPLDIAVAKGNSAVADVLRAAMARHEARSALSSSLHAGPGF